MITLAVEEAVATATADATAGSCSRRKMTQQEREQRVGLPSLLFCEFVRSGSGVLFGQELFATPPISFAVSPTLLIAAMALTGRATARPVGKNFSGSDYPADSAKNFPGISMGGREWFSSEPPRIGVPSGITRMASPFGGLSAV